MAKKVRVLPMVHQERPLFTALEQLALLASKQNPAPLVSITLLHGEGHENEGECIENIPVEGVDFGAYVVDDPEGPNDDISPA